MWNILFDFFVMFVTFPLIVVVMTAGPDLLEYIIVCQFHGETNKVIIEIII